MKWNHFFPSSYYNDITSFLEVSNHVIPGNILLSKNGIMLNTVIIARMVVHGVLSTSQYKMGPFLFQLYNCVSFNLGTLNILVRIAFV